MNDSSELKEQRIKVPEVMYQSFLVLQNERKLKVFDVLCKARGKQTTKDIEVTLGRIDSSETIGYIADALRDLENVQLAKYVGEDSVQNKPIPGQLQARSGDWKQTFKCYEATDHGRYIHALCESYDSSRPLANLGGSLDPKRIVESFSKLQKDELAKMLTRFRDMYFLGAVLISIYYQKHESATSQSLSRCVELSMQEVDELLSSYSGSDGLVLTSPVERNKIERGFIRLAESLAGKNRVRKWLSRADYSLTPEGKRIARTLSEDFYPSDLGVNEENLRREKIEWDHGVLGRAIAERIVAYGFFVGLTGYVWWDLFLHKFTAGIVVDLILFLLTFIGWVFLVPFRLPNLWTRIAYWRDRRRDHSK